MCVSRITNNNNSSNNNSSNNNSSNNNSSNNNNNNNKVVSPAEFHTNLHRSVCVFRGLRDDVVLPFTGGTGQTFTCYVCMYIIQGYIHDIIAQAHAGGGQFAPDPNPANFGFLLARRRSPAAFSSLQRGSQLVLETPFQFGTAGQLAIGSQTVMPT